MDRNQPFLFAFIEEEPMNKSLGTVPAVGEASNPIEEEPSPEPTRKTPWGD